MVPQNAAAPRCRMACRMVCVWLQLGFVKGETKNKIGASSVPASK